MAPDDHAGANWTSSAPATGMDNPEVWRLLGLDRERDILARWLAVLRDGLSLDAAEAVVEAGLLTWPGVERHVLRRGTLEVRRRRSGRFTPEETDRLARIVRIGVTAAKTFGGYPEAGEWLREPNGAFGGKCPLELLQFGESARLVEDVLTRIDHGVYT